jgi:hypothetical protein
MLMRAPNVFLERPWPTNPLLDRHHHCRLSTTIVRATSEPVQRHKAGRRNPDLANSQFSISRNGNPTDNSSSLMVRHHRHNNKTTDNNHARRRTNNHSRCARRLQAEAQVDVVQVATAQDEARHAGDQDC